MLWTLLAAPLLTSAICQDPLEGQLPKRDLGVDAFLAAHPEYDGRGVRVAVLDTGVDPGHPLLQRTSTGKRKLVDWYDATSDGRLDTSLRAVAEDGSLLGLSGRRLRLGRWNAEGRWFHLGRIDKDFLPGGLVGRMLADRKEDWQERKRAWEEGQRRHASTHDEATNGDRWEAFLKEEEARQWKEFDDPGPVYDVLVFRADGGWRVLVDSDEDGDLAEERALRPFKDSGDWAVLGDEALLNYAVDVSDNGALTHVYFDANGHGTHVAGIIGAFGGEGHRLNGVAPGVEIVAIKIGDGKFGGATSGFSIAKALDYAVASGCQVANMSFGGSSFFADGREPDAWVIDEATRRGLAVVTSAGNDGPALSTVGAPGTARSAFTIAAAIWPDTQRVNYGALRPTGPVLFDFSSRGPLPTGRLGVDFTAPGAAVSTLPSWLMTPAENFNGTSMAAPQATGCVALLASAGAAEGLAVEPGALYRALRDGARPLPQFTWVDQGHGAIFVPAAYEALQRRAAEEGPPARWKVTVENPFGAGGGIYERDVPSRRPFDRSVRIEPLFAEGSSNAEKAALLRTLRIRSEAPWVEAPDAVYVTHSGRGFTVRVRPAGLEEGLHSTRLLLYDADAPEDRGAEIVVPVTLVLPAEPGSGEDHTLSRTFELEPGELERTFVRVPYGARWARVTLTQRGAGRNEFRTGAGSLSGFRYSGDRQQRGRIYLDDGDRHESLVRVEPGTVFEFTVASRWAVNHETELELGLRFLGLVPQRELVHVPAGQGFAYQGVKSLLRAESVRAKASIEGVAHPVLAELQVVPDPIRPTVFGGRGMFFGVLEWPVTVPEDGTSVSVAAPGSIQTTEYREDLMLVVEDANGQIVHREIIPELDVDLGKLDAGEYTFRAIFPSLGTAVLEARYAGLEVRLAAPRHSLAVFGELASAFADGDRAGRISVPFGGARTAVAAVPELPPLDGGAYYYGSFGFESGDDTLLETPLRVDRPAAAATVSEAELAAEPGEEAESEEDEDEAAAARAAYEESLAEHDPAPGAVLEMARAWAAAEPLSAEARLAELDALQDSGFETRARQLAADFLRRYPREREAFFEVVAEW